MYVQPYKTHILVQKDEHCPFQLRKTLQSSYRELKIFNLFSNIALKVEVMVLFIDIIILIEASRAQGRKRATDCGFDSHASK